DGSAKCFPATSPAALLLGDPRWHSIARIPEQSRRSGLFSTPDFGLKIPCPQGRVGSIPTSGTNFPHFALPNSRCRFEMPPARVGLDVSFSRTGGTSLTASAGEHLANDHCGRER